MNKEMSLDVALDIIGTLRMMKMKEITAETDKAYLLRINNKMELWIPKKYVRIRY